MNVGAKFVYLQPFDHRDVLLVDFLLCLLCFKTRPCLRCYVVIPISSSGVRCARYKAILSLDISYSPYYDYTLPYASAEVCLR
jgi:hypothetical protein